MDDIVTLTGGVLATDQADLRKVIDTTEDGKKFRDMLRSLGVLKRIQLLRLVIKAKEEEPAKTWSEILREFLTILLEYLPLFLDLLK